jgi:hypothetical protein
MPVAPYNFLSFDIKAPYLLFLVYDTIRVKINSCLQEYKKKAA